MRGFLGRPWEWSGGHVGLVWPIPGLSLQLGSQARLGGTEEGALTRQKPLRPEQKFWGKRAGEWLSCPQDSPCPQASSLGPCPYPSSTTPPTHPPTDRPKGAFLSAPVWARSFSQHREDAVGTLKCPTNSGKHVKI